MKTSRLPLHAALLVAAGFAASSAQADLVYAPYFASENVNGDITAATTTIQARNNFIGMLSSSSTETFEGFTNVTSASGASLFGGKATVLPPANGEVTNITNPGDGATGRFNTTQPCTNFDGCFFLETAYNFTLSFGGEYSAFAFFGTDFSDFNGSVFIDLLELDASGQLVKVAGTHILVSGPSGDARNVYLADGTGDGSLLHFGLTDSTRTYAGVSFSVEQNTTNPGDFDFLGFDDLVLGQFAGNTGGGGGGEAPEPGSLALAALALFGLAAARRQTQA